jgi:hypothetical protein
MSSQTRILFSFLAAALLIAGCKSKPSNPPDSTPPVAAQPAATPSQPSNAPAASTPATAAAADPSAATVEENKKLSAIDWALKQDEIKHDPNGQWATDASASSSYNDAKGDAAWSPMQVTGAPNVEHYGDDGRAWAPKTPDGGIEWLDLKYAKPVNATEVRIRESCGSGAVIQVELFDEQGNSHKVWRGTDPTQELNYFVLKVPPANYKTNRVKITLATNAVPGWNEIDAVQLVGK